ncbi:MAG TPA: GTP-binding protein, partial [Burkholderiaceae bacterium]|nr:GTP-binding protein [Burkholderiaceae bacterium]
VFRCAGSISETRLDEALAELPPSVIRLKGFVRLDSSPQRLRLVQGVGRRCTISEANSTVEQEGSALVVIGVKEVLRDEDLTSMRELFNQSLR